MSNRWKSHLNVRKVLCLKALRKENSADKKAWFLLQVLYISCLLVTERHKKKRIHTKIRKSLLYRKLKYWGGGAIIFTYLNAAFPSGIHDTRWRSRDRRLRSTSSLISFGPHVNCIYPTQNQLRTSDPSANHPNTNAAIHYNASTWMRIPTSSQKTQNFHSILLLYAQTTQFLSLYGSPCPHLTLSVQAVTV